MSPNSKIIFELEKIWYLNIQMEYLIQMCPQATKYPSSTTMTLIHFWSFETILLPTEKRKFWKLFICMSSVIAACIVFLKAHNG